MITVAGTFTSTPEARSTLRDLEMKGVSPARMNLIQGNDKKGFEREHKPNGTAMKQGAAAGAISGVIVFGILFGLAGANPLVLLYTALYLGGIAMATAAGAGISAYWNMGASHDEALLYEEAKATNTVIAAVEVDDAMEPVAVHMFEEHGARVVRAGTWHPKGWKFSYPSCETPNGTAA